MTAEAAGSGLTRRQLARRTLALGSALTFASFPAGPAEATPRTTGGHLTLRPGSPERAASSPGT